MAKTTRSIIIVVAFAILAGIPLLHPGLHPTHDGEYHIVRFYEFDKVLRLGVLYPRWAPDLNYGYGIPLFNYVYPLPNYVASLLHLFGASFIDSFKLQMFLAGLFGAVFFYLWAREFWGDIGGVVSSIFYTFSPYRFVDIYVRGSVGEVWALALYPFFLWSVTQGINSKGRKYFATASISIALIIFSHNILALIFLPFAVSYTGFLIYRKKEKKSIAIPMLVSVLLGITLSSIFWVPAIFERQFVRGLEIYSVGDHFPQLYQLLFPSWGTGFSGPDISNQMSFQIGVANILAVILSIVVLIFMYRRRVDRERRTILFFLAWFSLIFFLMLRILLPIWRIVPFMNYIQFPWRLLSLEILVGSFLAGSVFYIWRSKILAIFAILFAVFLSIGYTRPAYYHMRSDSYYLTRSNFIDGTNSPGNLFNTIWIENPTSRKKEKIELINGKSRPEVDEILPQTYKFTTDVIKESQVVINTAYFPGWTTYIDKKKSGVFFSEDGLISFLIPKGKHHLEVVFEDTLIRKIAKVITMLGLFALVLLGRGNYVRIKQ